MIWHMCREPAHERICQIISIGGHTIRNKLPAGMSSDIFPDREYLIIIGNKNMELSDTN